MEHKETESSLDNKEHREAMHRICFDLVLCNQLIDNLMDNLECKFEVQNLLEDLSSRMKFDLTSTGNHLVLRKK